MNKYSEQQKLDAVETYRSGELGLRKTAELHGVNVASLRAWVAGFEAMGLAGVLRKRRQSYDLKFKIEVLQRIEAENLSHRQAGALFNIRNFSRIAEWERDCQKDGVAGLMHRRLQGNGLRNSGGAVFEGRAPYTARTSPEWRSGRRSAKRSRSGPASAPSRPFPRSGKG
ncbi:transposase [Roseateles sp. DC23W]|uniref:Transposase n=1 Tax=Pelomonas dachongensis TaxID=3299029 RepID=A0ABW7EV07_9BURK